MACIGYARVSSTDQHVDGQVERLKAAGCGKVFAEKMSGKSTDGRRELARALKALRPGDTLVTVRLDRLARSIRDLLNLLDQLKTGGVKFKVIEDPWIDTDSPTGELLLNVLASLAQFERRLIRQRCEEGIRRAKALGTKFGRDSVLDAGQRRKIAERHAAGEPMAALAQDYGCGVATIWRALHAPAI